MDPSGLASLVILGAGCVAWAWALTKGPQDDGFDPAMCKAEMPPGIGVKAVCDRPVHQLDIDPWHEVHNDEIDATWRVDGSQTRVKHLHQHTPKETP